MLIVYLLLIYLVTELILRKLTLVYNHKHFFLYPHYTNRFKAIEHMIFIFFTLGILLTIFRFYYDSRLYPYCFTLIFLLQFLVWGTRGAEQWLYMPKAKQYISSWMGAALMFIYACIFYFWS